MPLTPEDVRKKTFTPVRLREGYDMGEVDQFLDEVEVELTRLHEDNEDLRSRLAVTTSGTPAPVAAAKKQAKSESEATPTTTGPALPAVSTVAQASGAAARLLEIAAQNADQLVSEAHDDADKIIGEARTKAERLQADSKAKADQVEADSKNRSQRFETELSERRTQLFDKLERDRDNLARELEDLRAFEREYRSRLKSYFQSQLDTLEGMTDSEVPSPPSSDDETPPRLDEVLGNGKKS